jgi:hypothetical protein
MSPFWGFMPGLMYVPYAKTRSPGRICSQLS